MEGLKISNLDVHPDFILSQQLIYTPLDLHYKHLVLNLESQEYGACSFKINSKHIKYRVAKITPKKSGMFATFWKRIESGPIMPYDIIDSFDILIVSVRDTNHFGQFIFPKLILHEKGLLSGNKNKGKRAMRIYPPWSLITSKQAQKTQSWQQNYYFAIKPNNNMDNERLKVLF